MPRLGVADLPLVDFERVLDALSVDQLVEAEELFCLRRRLPGHTSDIVDAYVVARAFGWSLCQTGVFVAYLQQRVLSW